MKTIFSILFIVSLSGCDWAHHAFMNSVPFHGNQKSDMHVYLGVDGLSFYSMQEAKRRGYFSNPSWRLANFISIFPATSDASWTRILHTDPLVGYEFQYYDSKKDSLVNEGLLGVIKHILPTVADYIDFEAPYLKAFDYKANGYSHAVGAYHDTFSNLAESFDNFFFLLSGRVQTESVFAAYFLEFDVLGHMNTKEDILEGIRQLYERIESFKKQHSGRKILFTLFSDHGLDYIKVKSDHLVQLENDLPKLGISVVKNLKNHNPEKELYAIAVNHTRVTYMAIHTHPDLSEEISKRTSTLESVDVSVSKIKNPSLTAPWESYAVYSEGKKILWFAFNTETNQYKLPEIADYSKFGFSFSYPIENSFMTLDDRTLFNATKDSNYPDFFYRIRSGLSPIGTITPAEVLVSFKKTYAALGFSLPGGANDFAMSGFHGSLENLGSNGVLMTEERDLPSAVRSETLYDLFPDLKQSMIKKGIGIHETDKNTSLIYTD